MRAPPRHAAEARKLLGRRAADQAVARTGRAAQRRPRRGAVGVPRNARTPRHPRARLRGLHVEARRAGDADAALEYAAAPISTPRCRGPRRRCWTTRRARRLGGRARDGRIERGRQAARQADRQPLARGAEDRDRAGSRRTRPQGALALAQDALALAPGLVPPPRWRANCSPPTAISARRRRFSEAAYRETPHPDLAAAYLRVRHGDLPVDRLARARALARVAPSIRKAR